jgi:hypothetical protein
MHASAGSEREHQHKDVAAWPHAANPNPTDTVNGLQPNMVKKP